MSEHKVTVTWEKQGEFSHEGFARNHTATASQQSIPMSAANTPDHVDPEQALTFALSSCHMLTFLALAAKKRLVVASYEDEAIGILGTNDTGKQYVARIILNPKVHFEGKTPDEVAIKKMHDKAHDHCFIANSVISEVEIVL